MGILYLGLYFLGDQMDSDLVSFLQGHQNMALLTGTRTWNCAGAAAVAILMVLMNGIDSSMIFIYCIMVFTYFYIVLLFLNCCSCLFSY